MKKEIVCISICLLLSIVVLPTSGKVVEKSSIPSFIGNILYVGGSGPNNYTTIQSAVDNALDGDTVFVYDDSSPYYENVVVNKSINLIGENRNTTVIDGSFNIYVLEIIEDGVTVSGFTIQNGGKYSGISIKSDGCVISNNIIRDNECDGIRIRYSTLNNRICNNIIIDNNDSGVLQFNGNSKYLYIDNNTIRDNHRDGVTLRVCDWSSIVDNDILQSGGEGISLSHCSRNLIARNNISYNKKNGIDLYRSPDGELSHDNSIMNNFVGHNGWNGIKIRTHSRNNTISNNTVFASGENGIDIEDYAIGNIVRNNSCYKNEYGIVVVSYSCNNSILDNRLDRNIGGVTVYTYCENNNFSGNIFFRNRFGLEFTTFSWNNTIMNNCFKNNWIGIGFMDSSLNNISRNDFVKNLIMVDSLGSHNFWDGNFWSRPKLFPKPIFGREWRGNWLILLLDGVDWNPAQEPYDIGV